MTLIVDVNSYRAAVLTYKDVGYERLSQLYIRDVQGALEKLKGSGNFGVLLQTCNRIELYTYGPSSAHLDINLAGNPRVIEGFDVFVHLTRVVCGLESMAVGERQIAGQVRRYYSLARRLGTVNPPLQLLFDEALRIGKKVRSEVQFERAVDYISSAVKIVSRKLPGRSSLAVIGTGETAKELVARLGMLKGRYQVYVLGRDLKKAESVAKEFGATPLHLQKLRDILATVDGVLVATSAGNYLIRREDLDCLSRNMLIVDLSIPPSVDPAVRGGNLELYTMENLSELVKLNRELLKDEVRRAEDIVNQELRKLYNKLRNNAIEAILARIYKAAEAIREEEVKEALKHIERCDPCHKEELVEIISDFSRSLIKKLLHHHAESLRGLALKGELDDKAMSLIIKLFMKGG